MVRLHRNVLWGGCREKKKIPWVRWAEVCKPKSGGGLGVKDLSAFNQSLLGKWRWQLVAGNSSLWRNVLVAKYGPDIIGTPSLSTLSLPRVHINLVERYMFTWFRDGYGWRLVQGEGD